MLQELRNTKKFLKTEFSQTLTTKSEFACHCSTYALSDPEEKLYQTVCNHPHTKICNGCEQLGQLLMSIRKEMDNPDLKWQSQHQKPDLVIDMEAAASAIEEWRAHLLRAFHHSLAKSEFLDTMTECQAYIIMDWATKFLPARFREKQIDFFGKRGKPWHGICIFLKQNGDLKVR
ncbi:MAG: hypothetical protein GY696_08550 [Gammaproteobacteria bacterium]|nr:hypothetical protein [Gammaproteobacteria bacterium]